MLLFSTLVDWQAEIGNLAHAVKMQRPKVIEEGLSEEGRDVLRIPPLLEKHLERIHVVGAAAVPLSRAIISTMFARRMQTAVLIAIRDYQGENIEVVSAFRGQLLRAANDLGSAIESMGDGLHDGRK